MTSELSIDSYLMKELSYQIGLEYAEDILIALAILLLMGIEIWAVKKGTNYLKSTIKKFSFQPFKFRSFELLNIGKQRLFLTGIITCLQILIILLIIYFSLIFTLSILPGTEDVANKLIEFIFLPLKNTFIAVTGYLPRLFTVLITVIIFRYLVSMVKSVFREIDKKKLNIQGFEPHWARTTGSIIVFLLNTLMLIMILPDLPGYKSLAFKGVIAFLGALITIGGSSVIANYMAGIVVTYMNSFRLGDWVKIDNTTGEITEISPFAIKLRTAKMVVVSIPNSRILTTHINNFSSEFGNQRVLLHTTVSIGYDVSWKTVNELLISAAEKTASLDLSTPPFVRQHKLDDFYVVYELNAYSKEPSKMSGIYSEMHKHILEEFNVAGVEILSPHYRVDRGWGRK